MQDNGSSDEELLRNHSRIYKHAYISMCLLAINVIVFVLSGTILKQIYEDGAMVTELVIKRGEFHRLFTAIFIHADVNHLMNNMIMLFLVGAVVEEYTGHFFYFFLYMLSGIFGNIISMGHEVHFNLKYISVGASGSIMGIVGFVIMWIIINWKSFVKSRNVIIRLGILAVFILEAVTFQKGANTTAHFGGLLTGMVMGFINIVILKNKKKMEGLA
ncbi:rhomboid family intramembrane serine protease [Butyrivibrio sp. AE2032]|uniref:rhomboid family intramembrane serine protease n=1 Tax=Butyrivibrio sp. AE2032 TaxID=1458463 RepID=UPI000554FE79|nr:rhomboid family intramembrane serine protease [Butyrivibrio sp. AE2032]